MDSRLHHRNCISRAVDLASLAVTAGTASATYVQAELQGALNRVAAMEARLRSLDAALFAHGLIGT